MVGGRQLSRTILHSHRRVWTAVNLIISARILLMASSRYGGEEGVLYITPTIVITGVREAYLGARVFLVTTCHVFMT